MVNYNIDFNDSVLTFDENISFKDDAKFKFQELNMTLYIPYYQPFEMDEKVERIIRQTIYRGGYNERDIPNNTWIFTDNGKLYCTTCEDDDDDDEDSYSRYDNSEDESGYFDERHLNNVDVVSISGAYEVVIRKGDKSSLVISGDERDIEEMNIVDDNYELTIDSDRSFNINDDFDSNVKIEITIASLKEIEFEGAVKAKIRGFDQSDMKIDLSGASKADIDADIGEVTAEVKGASKLELNGKGETLIVKVTSASRLDAFQFEVNSAEIKSRGAANVKVLVNQFLDIDASGVSVIRYKGEPKLQVEKSRTSTVTQY